MFVTEKPPSVCSLEELVLKNVETSAAYRSRLFSDKESTWEITLLVQMRTPTVRKRTLSELKRRVTGSDRLSPLA
jgi:hypothetical protein